MANDMTPVHDVDEDIAARGHEPESHQSTQCALTLLLSTVPESFPATGAASLTWRRQRCQVQSGDH